MTAYVWVEFIRSGPSVGDTLNKQIPEGQSCFSGRPVVGVGRPPSRLVLVVGAVVHPRHHQAHHEQAAQGVEQALSLIHI